jgi:VWFA-related protein
MRWRIQRTLVCLGVLVLSVGVMRSQAPQNSQTDSATAGSPQNQQNRQNQSTGKSACATVACGDEAQRRGPVIRTTTRLVQVSVVVTDKKGLPVIGLKKDDFTILDDGQAQKIAVFSSEAPVTASQPPRALPPNIFTNRHDKLGEPPGSNTVIFLDALNTRPLDQAYAREQVIKFLKTIQPQDHFAIYALTAPSEVLIVHEFTQDDAALVKAIKAFDVKQPSSIWPLAQQLDFPGLPQAMLPMVPQDEATSATGARGSAELRDELRTEYARFRVYPEVQALINIANHVATIPGRKNLIWITGGVRRSSSSQPLPDTVRLADWGYRIGAPQYATTEDELFRAVGESFNAANLVMYGVDVHGTQVDPGMDANRPAGRNAGGVPTPTQALRSSQGRMNQEQSLRDTYRLLAEETGGNAFYGNNDITEGMSKAFDDGRYAYMIGYYPDHGMWDGKFRKVEIKVGGENLHTRFRDGYYAKADDSAIEDPEKQMQVAAASPLDSNALSMMVSAQHEQPATKRELDFQVGVDVAQLLLQHAQGHWKGGIDLMFVQKDETTAVVAAEKKHIDLDFTDAQYQEMQTRGAIFERHLALLAEAKEVRVLVRDAGSGQIGTVSVLLRRFFPEDAGPENPKTK